MQPEIQLIECAWQIAAMTYIQNMIIFYPL